MVYVEISEHHPEDYGTRILRIPFSLMEALGIEDRTVVEIITKVGKRIGVIACLDPFSTHLEEKKAQIESDVPSPPPSTHQTQSDQDLPKPKGGPLWGDSEIDRENIIAACLDGEVRLSFGLNRGDLIEVDTILPPQKARNVYINVLGRDPQLYSDEERHLLMDQLKQQLGLPLTAGLTISVNLAFKEEKILIQATEPDGIVLSHSTTNFHLNETFVPSKIEKDKICWEHIGGLRDCIHRIRKLVEIPIRRPEIFDNVSITPPRGILLVGSTGVGKTLVMNALANESGAKIIKPPPNLFAGVGATEKNIRELFKTIKKESRENPVLFLVDNLETLVPAPYLNIPEYVRRFSLQFALGIDSLKKRNVIIVGACHSADNIDPIVRRPGRFDIEIELNVPSEQERMEILQIHLRTVPLGEDINQKLLKSYVNRMTGFVGADIASFVKEACMRAVGRFTGLFSVWGAQIPPSVLRMIKVELNDFEAAFKSVEPSALRSIHSKISNPNVSWEDVGGLSETKELLKEQIEWQFKKPEVLREMGVRPSGGMLFYGPPGNGKTLLAKALATELKASFISVKGPELLSVWFGESAKIIRELFAKAKKLAPCIIFFDEIDAMVPRRGGDQTEGGREIDATVNQLLTILDGMESSQGIFVMGATNRPGALDLALLRPGRLDKLVLIPSPDENGRKEILDIHTRKIPIKGNKNKIISELAGSTELMSGADLENLCREAVLESLREDFSQRFVRDEHFKSALKKVYPSVDPDLLDYYNKFQTEIIGAQGNEILSKKPMTYR